MEPQPWFLRLCRKLGNGLRLVPRPGRQAAMISNCSATDGCGL